MWDGNKPLHEWAELELGLGADSVGEDITWLFEEDSFTPAAKLTAGGGAQSVVCDHLGTPLELYDVQGVLTWQAQLDSYGAVREGKGRAQDCPFRYQGQYKDIETGLYFNRFRYYDPEAGRYISQDPIGLAGGWEFYAYVKDPCTWIDPVGLARIHTSGNVAVSAYPGPAVGGIEHAPLHVHVVEGRAETRVLMEDYIKKGKLIARRGEVYPGDPKISKSMKNVIGEILDDLAAKARVVFETGVCPR